MKSHTKGIILLMTALLAMFGAAGTVEMFSPEAGYLEWISLVGLVLVATVSAFVGLNLIKKEETK
jgi:hypothetical protein